jgi:hypothetical protein
MARNLILQNLMKLAQGIGANPQKFMGTRTNINFLGKGPTKNPLFQRPLAGIDEASLKQLGPEMIPAVEDAMGYASAGKLNSIQLRILTENLAGINKAMNPPVLPTITDMVTGTRNLTPGGLDYLRKTGTVGATQATKNLKPLRPGYMQELAKEGKLGHQNVYPEGVQPGSIGAKAIDESINIKPGLKFFEGAELPQKTYAARATMIKLLDMEVRAGGVTLREIMSPTDLKFLLEGGGGVKGDPIALFAKYFGNSTTRQLPSAGTPKVIEEFAKKIIRKKDRMGRRIDDPFFSREDLDFAEGGLAHILQVPRSGYSKGRAVKSLMGIVNKRFGKGTLKKASDITAGTKYDDLAAVNAFERREMIRKKYQGLIDDDLLNKILIDDNPQRIAEVLATIDEALIMQNVKGMNPESIIASFKESWKRKPSASGGLARILEV